MSSKKIEKALYGPSTTEVALGALLGLLLGVALAVVYLIAKPVEVVTELPKQTTLGTVYHIRGAESSSKAWQNKQTELLAGKSVQLSETELNGWAAALGEAEEKPEAKKDAFFLPGEINFRILGDQLQVSLPLTLNYFGVTFDTVVVTTGKFVRSGDRVEFAPEKTYLGSCPLHLFPGVDGFLVGRLVAGTSFSDELRVAWDRVTSVEVTGGVVKVIVQ